MLVFIDNDGARHSWIRGSAESVHAMRMIHKGSLLEASLEIKPFFCRVPTSSNVAERASGSYFQFSCESIFSDVSDVNDVVVVAHTQT